MTRTLVIQLVAKEVVRKVSRRGERAGGPATRASFRRPGRTEVGSFRRSSVRSDSRPAVEERPAEHPTVVMGVFSAQRD